MSLFANYCIAALTAYHPHGWTDQTGQAGTRTRVHIPVLICFNQGQYWLILSSIFFLITDIVPITLIQIFSWFPDLFQVLFMYFYWAKYSWQPGWSGIERFSFAQKSPHWNPKLRFRFRSNRVWIGLRLNYYKQIIVNQTSQRDYLTTPKLRQHNSRW